MIEFSDAERAYLNEMRMLTTDANGQDVFVGLTPDETDFYVSYSRLSLAGTANPDDADRYLELNEKHEQARLSIIGAEAELRVEKPPRH